MFLRYVAKKNKITQTGGTSVANNRLHPASSKGRIVNLRRKSKGVSIRITIVLRKHPISFH